MIRIRTTVTKKQNGEKYSKEAGIYLLYLIRCALNEEIPDKLPENCTWEEVWNFAKRSNVEATAWPAVKSFEDTLDKELFRKWKGTANSVLYRELQFDVEREKILARMSENGISWLPLKGIYLKEDYPKPGMRYMCDNDILYGFVEPDKTGGFRIRGETEEQQKKETKKAQKLLQKLMEDMRYQTKELNGNHDAYHKKPMFNFEMHRDLLPKFFPLYEYYENPWKRAVLNKDAKYGYHFMDEDKYLFMIVHAFKHYSISGCGIRTLADEYVFLKRREHTMNWDYIQKELETLKLAKFEQQMRTAAVHAFSKNQTLTEQDLEMMDYMLKNGTYGTEHTRIKNEIIKLQKEEKDSNGKKKYIWQRIFFPEDKMKEYYPFFYKHKSMRVFLPFYRVIKGLIIHPKKLINEFQILKKIKKI